jgi:hypothetical protein
VADDLCFFEDEASAIGAGDDPRFDSRVGGEAGREMSTFVLFLPLSLPVKGSSVVCRTAALVTSTGLEGRGGDTMER